MIKQETVEQIQYTSISDRIQLIEMILQSLKHDIQATTHEQTQSRPFKIRTFNLGQSVHVDRELIYAERIM